MILPEIGENLFGTSDSAKFKITSVRRTQVLCPKCKAKLYNIRTKYPPASELRCGSCDWPKLKPLVDN